MEVFVSQHTDTEGIDQWVAEVAMVEDHLTADVRQAETIPVTTDASDDPRKHSGGVRLVQRSEAERIHHCDRSRPHRQDVADDAADTRRGSLVRLYVAGMVVRFDLERHGVAEADVDHPGVLPDSGEQLANRSLRCQLTESAEVHF